MKLIYFILGLEIAMAAMSAWSQGVVNINNRNPSANIVAPISYDSGGSLPGGSINGAEAVENDGFLYGGIYARAAVYAGPVGTPEDALVILGPAVGFRTGAAAGYLALGTNVLRVVTNVPPGSVASLQLRVWDAGSEVQSEEEAIALMSTRAVGWGRSSVLNVLLGDTNSPAALTGLESFSVFNPFFAPPLRLYWTSTRTNILIYWDDYWASCPLCQFQGQTNLPEVGLTGNWSNIVSMTNRYSIPINSSNGSVFFRLVRGCGGG